MPEPTPTSTSDARSLPQVRYRVVPDPDADYSWLAEQERMAIASGETSAGADPYYLPESHEAYGVVMETQCEACGAWSPVESVWAIDLLVAQVPLGLMGVFGVPDTIPEPYVRQMAVELRDAWLATWEAS